MTIARQTSIDESWKVVVDVTVVNRGEQCLKTYSKQLTIVRDSPTAHGHESPYDSVILDYKLPDINGLEVAKEILTLNLHQRIIIVSAYASEILSQDSVGSNFPMEVLEKPISNEALIDTVEDTAIFNELKKFDLNVDAFKRGGFSHEQLRDLADILKKVKSQFIFPFLSCNILYIFNQFNDAVLTFGS